MRADNCQRGYPSQCGGMLGGWKFANVKDGSFAEYFHVNNAVANLALIPDGLSDEQGIGDKGSGTETLLPRISPFLETSSRFYSNLRQATTVP